MKKSRIDFVFEDAFFFACMVFLYRWFQERMGWLAFVFCILFSLIRKRRTVPVLAVLLLLASMSFYSDDVPTIQSGRVVKVGGNYAEVADGRFRVLLYTDSEILYDSVITFSGTPEAIESTPS